MFEQATLARMRTRRIAEVWTYWRIFKDGRGAPRRLRRTPIAAILQKIQLELQNLENVAIVLSHRYTSIAIENARGSPERPYIESLGIVI
ncbi:MAG: hypothetical protein DMG78_14085 [Acidobacteria bacterium]|nr:MAG: hypothetical protein DMG78_14085 [Acidobacteriota bacterium]